MKSAIRSIHTEASGRAQAPGMIVVGRLAAAPGVVGFNHPTQVMATAGISDTPPRVTPGDLNGRNSGIGVDVNCPFGL